MTVLETKSLIKHYGTEPNLIKALDSVDIKVNSQEFVTVIGASGSGKSTLLHMLGGLDTPTSGSVFVMDNDLAVMKEKKLTDFRRKNIGFIFQSYNLIPVLNVYDNIVLPVVFDGSKIDKPLFEEISNELGLADKLKKTPNTLSGGEQQRVAIARALITKPVIILADEPTGNLDTATGENVLSLLKTCATKFAQTIVMITHNDTIAKMGDRVLKLKDGKLV